MKSKVVFGNKKLKEAYEKLKNSKTEDKILYKWIWFIKKYVDLNKSYY
jgi:hypothetical protein